MTIAVARREDGGLPRSRAEDDTFRSPLSRGPDVQQCLRGRKNGFVELVGCQLIASSPLDQIMDSQPALTTIMGKVGEVEPM